MLTFPPSLLPWVLSVNWTVRLCSRHHHQPTTTIHKAGAPSWFWILSSSSTSTIPYHTIRHRHIEFILTLVSTADLRFCCRETACCWPLVLPEHQLGISLNRVDCRLQHPLQISAGSILALLCRSLLAFGSPLSWPVSTACHCAFEKCPGSDPTGCQVDDLQHL